MTLAFLYNNINYILFYNYTLYKKIVYHCKDKFTLYNLKKMLYCSHKTKFKEVFL